MFTKTMIGLAIAGLAATPVLAQDQAGAPVEATAAAAPQAAPAASGHKMSLAEKMAIAAGAMTAGFAAFQALKHSSHPAPAPATTAAPEQPQAQ